jgi:hypothetical protein
MNTTKLSRRRLLAGVPAAAETMAPAAAAATALASAPLKLAGDDPIFTLIERYEAAEVECIAAIDESQELEQLLPSEKIRGMSTTEPNPDDDPRWTANCQRIEAAHNARYSAARELLEVYPTTVEGLIALLRCGEAYELPEMNDDEGSWMDSLPLLCSHAADALEEMFSEEASS